MTTTEFITGELKRAESELKFRSDAVRTWRGGTEESWRSVGCKLNKAQRMKSADIHERIQIKVLRRVEMFQAVLKELQENNSR